MDNDKFKPKASSSKVYVVVEFMLKGTIYVSAAPRKWVNGTQCSWPKKDRETKAIKECQDPTEDWNKIDDIKILGEYSTFKEARFYEQRFAKTDDETDDCSEKASMVKKMKRKSKPNMRYRDPSISPPPSLSLDSESHTDSRSSMEDEIIIDANIMNELPKSIQPIDSEITPTTLNNTITELAPTSQDDEHTLERIINEAPIIIETTTTTEQMTGINKILETLLDISGRLDIMENRMGNMEQVLNTSFSVNPQRFQNNISKLLPVKSIHELQELEQKLEDDSNKQQLLQVLQYIGGLNEKSCVGRSLERFFTNHCAMFCSWTGKKDNFKIKDLKSIQILKDAVRNSFPCIKDDAFERNVMAWLQFAKTRYDRGKQ